MAFFVWRGDGIMLLWLHPVISSDWDQWIPSEHPKNGECNRFMKILSGGLCFDLAQIWSDYFQCSQYKPLNKSKFLGKEKKEMRQRRKGEKRYLEGHQSFCTSLLTDLTSHSSSITAPTALHNFLYHLQYLNFCSHLLPKTTYRIFWEWSLQLNLPSFISKQKGFIWSNYKLEIFLLILQHNFAAFRLKLCLLHILSTEILSEN